MPTRSTKHSLEFICSFNHSIEKSLITMSFNQLRQSTNQPIINHDQPMNLSAHFQFTEFLATIFVESWIKGWMNGDYQLSVNQANWIIQRYTVSSCPAGGLLFNPSWHIFPLCWYSPNVRSYININSALVSFLDDLYDSNDVYDCTHILIV